MTHRFALNAIAKQTRRFLARSVCLWLVLSGCNQTKPIASVDAVGVRDVQAMSKGKVNHILAQGRIQPARGTLRIAALPGDRVDALLVQAGQSVQKQQPLVVLQSQKLKALELEAAMLKLEEAQAMRRAKEQEADLAIEAAEIKSQAASQILVQATGQLAMAKKTGRQMDSLRGQIVSLQSLRELPLTRAAIGTIELESKKNELLRIESMSEQSSLAAQQAVEMAKLQLTQSERLVVASKESRQLVDQSMPIGSLEKQIEILRMQADQSNILSPIDGVVVNVFVEPGERTTQLPLMELADIRSMVCVAEVHESDVASIEVANRAELQSSALGKTLRGRVVRIDRVVGSAQMRAPNPMARSDFRSIPVWIAIDAEDAVAASQRLQLQVDVTIHQNPQN